MSSCQNYSGGRQTGNGTFETISKIKFKKKMKQKANHALIDVLTPSEYQKGTIGNAKNLDWNDANFVIEISKIDKPKPVFIFVKKEGIVERH